MIDAFSFTNLYRHYLTCRKNKRSAINVLRFELNAENQLYQLSCELQDKSYHPSLATCFVLEKPKLREIIAADFRDRVVHYVLVEHLEAIYEPKFIHDSYACRDGKGIHKAVTRLHEFIGILNSKFGTTYYLQLDIKSFFLSINKIILMNLVKRHVIDENMLWLADKIINFNVQDNHVVKGRRELFATLPEHKSLIKSGNGAGLPIGNLTSQFFANLYLNELDQYVKHNLRCKCYLRYCDDFILLGKDKEQLSAFKLQITAFLKTRLGLELNPNYGDILPASNGIDFLGYVTRHKYQLVRRRVVGNLSEKLSHFKSILVKEMGGGKLIYCHDADTLNKLHATLSSYWGHFIHADSCRLRLNILKNNSWLNEYFALDNTLVINKSARFKPKYNTPKLWNRVAEQYNYYIKKFTGIVVLFQVGQYIEFYKALSPQILTVLKLGQLKDNKRGAVHGFPQRFIDKYKYILEAAGYSWVTICETGRMVCGIKERLPYERLAH